LFVRFAIQQVPCVLKLHNVIKVYRVVIAERVIFLKYYMQIIIIIDKWIIPFIIEYLFCSFIFLRKRG
jgi:hypothetical protein